MLPNRYIGKEFGKSSILTIFSIAPDFFAVFEQVISLESVKKHAHNGGTWNRHDPVFQYFLKGESDFNKTHSPSGQFTENGKIFKYPVLSQNDY